MPRRFIPPPLDSPGGIRKEIPAVAPILQDRSRKSSRTLTGLTALFFSIEGIIVLLFALQIFHTDIRAKINDLAATFFVDSSTEQTLKTSFEEAKSNEKKLKILIVPGHDDAYSGTEFRGIREADLTVRLAERLVRLLKIHPRFDVYVSRSAAGYNPDITEFLEKNKGDIQTFVKNQKALTQEYIALGKIESRVIVDHPVAPSKMAGILYGINKWANDRGIDVIIHVHFNDYPRKNQNVPGLYSGFSIYVPERQYSNAKGSRALAQTIFQRLSQFYPTSDLPKEDIGIVEDQELIGVGAYNTLDGASLLIEYGYIYEPILRDGIIREAAFSDLALQTYLGIMDFFEEKEIAEDATAVTYFLPYDWKNDLFRDAKGTDIAALQAALIQEDTYPPDGNSKNECPITGRFGSCTEQAVKNFQKKYSIEPASGYVGEKTRAKLNELYGVDPNWNF